MKSTTLLFVFLSLLCTSAGIFAGIKWQKKQSTCTVATSNNSTSAPGDLLQSEQHTIALFEKTSVNTVFITTKAIRRDYWSMRDSEVVAGSGSGFFWDDKGHIVTNFHVIKGASSATVVLSDGRQFSAKLTGISERHDLAVLQIEGENLPGPLVMGDSQLLRAGQNVYAIGNPFGLDHTFTGIVSALQRNINGINGQVIEDLIQTDAAINPGNSGGPLLDSAGRLIGINTAIYSPSGTNAGIGFAIPINTLKRVVPQLVENGEYSPPSLGIQSHKNLSGLICRHLGVTGLLILKVQKGSSAEKAGLRETIIENNRNVIPGDIILSIDNQKIQNADDLLRALDRHKANDQVSLNIWRDGKTIEINCELR